MTRKGLVTKLIGGRYTIMDQESKEKLVCMASGKLRHVKLNKKSPFQKDEIRKETKYIKLSPKVGDIITYEPGDTNYIIGVDERTNSMKRPDMANIDVILLIFAAKEPEFSFILLDRFLSLIAYEGIEAKIIITKKDLLNEKELAELVNVMNYYKKIGYEVHFTSSKKNLGLDDIKGLFENKVSVLAGQTGAGKSSLLNALDSMLNIKTAEISYALGRGKHTTRHTELISYGGGLIADTPGFSSLEYGHMDINALAKTFIEFENYQCKFNGCLHLKEPKCGVRGNPDILLSRYENYVRFNNEISSQKRKY